MGHLIVDLVLPEPARYIYPGRDFSGKLDMSEKYRNRELREIPGKIR